MPQVPKLSTVAVMLHIAGNPSERNYASAIMSATGYPSGTVVPILARMAERDGLLTKREVKVATGRPRVQYECTALGWAEAKRLLALITPVVRALPEDDGFDADTASAAKANSSTLWILAAANSAVIVGSSPELAPLTHQAAYVELRRLADTGLLHEEHNRFTATANGVAFGARLRRRWEPAVTLASAQLKEKEGS